MTMEKREGFLWGIAAGGLVLLYLSSSTDLIIKERETEVYPVSIVIGDTTDDYYVNFRKGADQAAEDYNADISFITLFEKGDAFRQIELLRRETDDGASAVILEPVDSIACSGFLNERACGIPIVAAGEMTAEDPVKSLVSADYFEQGELLGEAIAGACDAQFPVYVLTEALENGSTRERYDGLRAVLSKQDYEVQLYEWETEETIRQVIESTVYPGNGSAVLAALDPSSTALAAEIIEGSPVYGIYIAGLYGTGTTPAILNQLDRGTIQGLVVSDEYEQGYLCVEHAVKAIRKENLSNRVWVDSFYIEKKELRDPVLEKILYPID